MLIENIKEIPGQIEKPADPDEHEPNAETELTLPELPYPFSDMISEVSEIYRVHRDLPTIITLATVSGTIGKTFVLDAPPYMVAANLYVLPTAPSGSGKTKSFNEITRPYYEAQQEALDQWRATKLPSLKAEETELKAKQSKLVGLISKGQDEEDTRYSLEKIAGRLEDLRKELIPARLLAEDVTTQKLTTMLEASNETLSVFTSEAGDVLSNLAGRYNSSGRTDETLYLKGFLGEPVLVDRVGSESVSLSKPCITTCWLTTPIELAGLFATDRYREGGLLPRFLICESLSRPEKRTAENRHFCSAIQASWKSLIYDILDLRGQNFVITPTPEAMEMFINYENHYVDQYDIVPEASAFNSRRGVCAERIALVIHAARYRGEAADKNLTAETARLGCEIFDYYGQAHAGMIQRGLLEKDMEDLERISRTALKYGAPHAEGNAISLREIDRRNGIPKKRVELLAKRYPDELRIEVSNPPSGRKATLAIVLGK